MPGALHIWGCVDGSVASCLSPLLSSHCVGQQRKGCSPNTHATLREGCAALITTLLGGREKEKTSSTDVRLGDLPLIMLLWTFLSTKLWALSTEASKDEQGQGENLGLKLSFLIYKMAAIAAACLLWGLC